MWKTTMASLTRLPCLPTAKHTALSTSLWWLEAQDDCNLVRLQLVHRLQQNAVMKRSTKLTQRHVTSFFCWLMQLHKTHVVIARSTSSWIIKSTWINLIIHNLHYPNVFLWSQPVQIIAVGLYRSSCVCVCVGGGGWWSLNASFNAFISSTKVLITSAKRVLPLHQKCSSPAQQTRLCIWKVV